jgi:hypothetical protein
LSSRADAMPGCGNTMSPCADAVPDNIDPYDTVSGGSDPLSAHEYSVPGSGYSVPPRRYEVSGRGHDMSCG